MRRGGAGANFIDEFQYIDVGGGDRGPCFPAIPRGCVECVVCRTRTGPITVKDRGGGGL